MATLCADCRMPVRPVNECICDDDPDDAEASPAAASLTVNVSGSVVSERDLLDTIQSAMLKRGH